jgi:hypothetical protein
MAMINFQSNDKQARELDDSFEQAFSPGCPNQAKLLLVPARSSNKNSSSVQY